MRMEAEELEWSGPAGRAGRHARATSNQPAQTLTLGV